MSRLLPCFLALGLLTATGCATLSPALAPMEAAKGTVTVTVKVFAPATQVALIAAGGLNYRLSARPDEAPVPGAKVSYGTGKSAITDTTGEAKLELAPMGVHKLTVSYKLKSGEVVSLPAVGLTGSEASSQDLDAANIMVAAAINKKGSSPAAPMVGAAVGAMGLGLEGTPRVPEFTNEAAALKAFDELATPAIKELLGL
ncbi:MAG: hypothetical protein VKS61_10665 [Candidatus Sericytochromatia bacterium]|nr:hypothetical protein [Candidatus Sericytochromatia bacterium]